MYGVIEMNKNNVDEKIAKWNDIFEELAFDAKSLINELSEGINYIAASGFIAILMGAAALVIGLDRGETKYIASGFMIFCILTFNGAMTLRKWYTLKMRYKRLHDLGEKLKSN